MQVVCIKAHGAHVPGDLVEVPDGAQVSPVHFAETGTPEAETGVAEGARIAAARAEGAEQERAGTTRAVLKAPATTGSTT